VSGLTRVENDLASRELVLHWRDRPAQRLPHAELRRACPCAFCRADRLRGRHWPEDSGIRVRAARSMGYGLQLVFSDGHDRGIFPWPFLAGLASGPSPAADAAGAQPSAG